MKNSAAVAVAQSKYGQVATGAQKLTVRLYLDVTNHQVVFSCNPEEHVSNYRTREVVFEANFKCTIVFSNSQFFTEKYLLSDRGFTGMSTLSLDSNKPKSLFVAVDEGETKLNVTVKISDTEEIVTDDVRMPIIIHIP